MDFWKILTELFSIPVKWDIYVILVVIIYTLFWVLGFYLISQQIKLVKAEVFSIIDYMKCVFYATILATGFIVIIIIFISFAWQTQSQYFIIPFTGDLSAFLLWAYAILVFFLFLFPIFDLLYIAHSQKNKGLTIFQEFIAKKLLHKLKRPLNYLVAIGIYFLLYIFPLFLLISIGFPPIIAITTIAIAIPIIILNYFATLGYVGNLVSTYYNITNISRSQFYVYGKSNRLEYELTHDGFRGLVARINLGLQIFLYGWLVYSFIRTVSLPFLETVPTIQTALQWQVFVSLLFGIWGYFSRFWFRKVKFRWMDILFSAWLVAVTGLNVMVNYILSNSLIFKDIFEKWSFTVPIMQNNTFKNGDFLYFVPVAVIEELNIVGLATYYLLSSKNNFVRNSKFSKIDLSARNFDPIPLFNFIYSKDNDKDIREYAMKEIIRMYERIPNRKGLNVLNKKFMYPLFDSLSDSNKYVNKTGLIILSNYLDTIPDKIIPKVLEHLKDYNYDLKLRIGELILNKIEKIGQYIPLSLINSLLNDKEYHIRMIGLKLMDYFIEKNLITRELLPLNSLKSLINDVDLNIQEKCLELFLKHKLPIEEQVIIQKIFSSNDKIKSIAIITLPNIIKFDEKKISSNIIEFLLNLLQSSQGTLESSILKTLSNIGNFRKNKIPIGIFLKGLLDTEKEVRISAVNGLLKYIEEEKNQKEIRAIINQIVEIFNKSAIDVKTDLLTLFLKLWKFEPKESLKIFVQFLKNENDNVRKICIDGINLISTENLKEVLNELVSIQDEKTYFGYGIIAQTLAKIIISNPKSIEQYFNYLQSNSETQKINIANAINIIAEQKHDLIDIKNILNLIILETNTQVKNLLIKSLIKIAESNMESLLPYVNSILNLLQEDDPQIKLSILKLLDEVSKSSTISIPIENIVILLNDRDSFIREQSIKILANLYPKLNKDQINSVNYVLNELLDDKDWNVKDVALDTIEKIGLSFINSELMNKIINLLDEPKKYIKIKVLNLIAQLINLKPEIVSLINKIINFITDNDAEIRRACAQVFANTPKDLFNEIFPYIVQLMGDKEQIVREAAEFALLKLSSVVPLKDLLPMALEYFSDEVDIEIQRSMALTLKRILKYENKLLKDRLIDILKIRCEISQDPILFQVLQELKED